MNQLHVKLTEKQFSDIVGMLNCFYNTRLFTSELSSIKYGMETVQDTNPDYCNIDYKIPVRDFVYIYNLIHENKNLTHDYIKKCVDDGFYDEGLYTRIKEIFEIKD